MIRQSLLFIMPFFWQIYVESIKKTPYIYS